MIGSPGHVTFLQSSGPAFGRRALQISSIREASGLHVIFSTLRVIYIYSFPSLNSKKTGQNLGSFESLRWDGRRNSDIRFLNEHKQIPPFNHLVPGASWSRPERGRFSPPRLPRDIIWTEVGFLVGVQGEFPPHKFRASCKHPKNPLPTISLRVIFLLIKNKDKQTKCGKKDFEAIWETEMQLANGGILILAFLLEKKKKLLKKTATRSNIIHRIPVHRPKWLQDRRSTRNRWKTTKSHRYFPQLAESCRKDAKGLRCRDKNDMIWGQAREAGREILGHIEPHWPAYCTFRHHFVYSFLGWYLTNCFRDAQNLESKFKKSLPQSAQIFDSDASTSNRMGWCHHGFPLPPFISRLGHLEGEPPYLGDWRSPWLLTTYKS